MEKTFKLIRGGIIGRISLLDWALSFLGIISIRLFLDNFVAKTGKAVFLSSMDVHNYLFFLLVILLVWLVLAIFLKVNPLDISRLMAWSIFGFIFPAVVDILWTGGSVFWSAYLTSDPQTLLSQYISIFGHLPSGIVYFGTKVVFLSGIILTALLIFVKTRSFFRALISIPIMYSVLFFMAGFPSFFYYACTILGGGSLTDISSVKVFQFVSTGYHIFGLESVDIMSGLPYNLNFIYFLATMFLLSILFFWGAKSKLLAFLKNARYPQLIYHSGLYCMGAALGYLAYPQNLYLNVFSIAAFVVLLASIILAWEASVIANDIFDCRIDDITNIDRPLQKNIFSTKEYYHLGVMLFLFSLLGGFLVGPRFMALLFIYQFIAWIYSAAPFRLKRFPGIATFLSAVASLTILFLGFMLFSGDNNLQGLSWRIIILLLLALTLSLPIKDFKDIAGDKADGVWTIPVLFGEEKGRLIVASGIFISFVSSTFFLNEFKLFWWSLLAGCGAFWVLTNKKIKPRQLFWWVMGCVSIYGMILIKILFIK